VEGNSARGSIAYEPCWQDGHSHDWRDCPTPEGLLDDPVVALAPKSSRVVRGKVMRRGK
jgi:hypothetical protein